MQKLTGVDLVVAVCVLLGGIGQAAAQTAGTGSRPNVVAVTPYEPGHVAGLTTFDGKPAVYDLGPIGPSGLPVGGTVGQVITNVSPGVGTWQNVGGLGYTPLNPALNLSELSSPATARSNLGLGSAATFNVGNSGASVPLLSQANSFSGPTSIVGVPFSANNVVKFSGLVVGTQLSCLGLDSGSNVVLSSAACGAGGGGGSGTVQSGTGPAIAQYSAGTGTTVGPATISGDGTMGQGGALTVTKTSGVAFAPSATTDTTNAANLTSGTLPNARVVALPLANLAAISTATILGNNTGSTVAPLALTTGQVSTMLGLGTMATQNASNVSISGGTATGMAVTGLATPSSSSDAATKAYVDAVASGSFPHTQVAAATAAVLPNTPTFSGGSCVGDTLTSATNTDLVVDGVTVPLNGRVLNKNDGTPSHNGIWQKSQTGTGSVPWILTRATDFDQVTPGEIAFGAFVFSPAGTANAGTGWTLNTTGTLVCDTTGLVWTQTSGSATYTADGTTILLSANQFSALPNGILSAVSATPNTILARGASTWAGITPVNNAVLSTNGSGVPSESTTLPTGLTIPGYATASGMTAGQLAKAGGAASLTSSVAAPTGAVVGDTDTQTLTNKTINGAVLSGTLSGTPTYSGVPIYSGLSAGTVVTGKFMGLDSGNHVVLATPAAGGTALTVTDGTHPVTNTASITFGANGFLVGGSAGAATVDLTVVVDTQSANAPFAIPSSESNKTLMRTNTVSQIDTIAAASTTGFGAGFGVSYVTSTVANTIAPSGSTIGGLANLVLGPNQYAGIFSDGVNYRTFLGVPTPSSQTGTTALLDTMQFGAVLVSGGNNTLSGVNTFTGAVIGAHSNVSASGNLDLSAAGGLCGKTIHYTGAPAGTLTVLASAVPDCDVKVDATAVGLATIAAAGSGTIVGNTACTATPRTKVSHSLILVHVESNSGTAPVLNVSGDCG